MVEIFICVFIVSFYDVCLCFIIILYVWYRWVMIISLMFNVVCGVLLWFGWGFYILVVVENWVYVFIVVCGGKMIIDEKVKICMWVVIV